MNKLDAFKNKIAEAKIAVLGLGISNVPLIRFLYNSGARNITAYDKFASPQVIANIDILNKEGMIKRAVTGEDYLEGIPSEKYDIIFKLHSKGTAREKIFIYNIKIRTTIKHI